ncbi:MAG TPA: DUF309 domain-containing protein [Candidatus Bathyarchaeia archaeon]|nr:DUF309 domain-containing protein [Candidatus Bathyarchaeia archaeon]
MRYLLRLANDRGYVPKDVRRVQMEIRELLGSSYKIGNLRISSSAIEFDLFSAKNELEKARELLEHGVSKVTTLRSIDPRVSLRSEDETLKEGIDLFNQERFWEAHESLEEIWHPAKGLDREVIQGLILTAAAFVHFQKDETAVTLSILGRALEKLGTTNTFRGYDVDNLRANIRRILERKEPTLFQVELANSRVSSGTR